MKTLDSLRGQRVGVVASGGLASWAVARFLAEQRFELRVFWADVGQTDEPGIAAFHADMARVGVPVVQVDLKRDVGELALRMLRYGASYEGQYWNSTGALRYVLMRNMAPLLGTHGCSTLVHGCVAGGNDERRFQRYASTFAPELDVFSPFRSDTLREKLPNRAAMVAYLRERCDAPHLSDRVYRSTDGCAIGASYEGSDIEGIDSDFAALKPTMSAMPWNALDAPAVAWVQFEHGRPIAVDGVALDARGVLGWANEFAGARGVSLRAVIENRIIGTKCRGVYESPGMDLLWFAMENLLRLALKKDDGLLYRSLSEHVGRSIYQGTFDDTTTRASCECIDKLVHAASATVGVRVYRGTMQCVGIRPTDAAMLHIQQRRFDSGGLAWGDAPVRV